MAFLLINKFWKNAFFPKNCIKKAHLATMAPHTLIRDRANRAFSAPRKTQCSSSRLEKNCEGTWWWGGGSVVYPAHSNYNGHFRRLKETGMQGNRKIIIFKNNFLSLSGTFSENKSTAFFLHTWLETKKLPRCPCFWSEGREQMRSPCFSRSIFFPSAGQLLRVSFVPSTVRPSDNRLVAIRKSPRQRRKKVLYFPVYKDRKGLLYVFKKTKIAERRTRFAFFLPCWKASSRPWK